MRRDIFEFWADHKPNEKIHSSDKYILERGKHHFDLRCLPANYWGPLKTARVVFLYLSPGLRQSDIDEANTVEAQARYANCRTGTAPLDGQGDHAEAFSWWRSKTKRFGDWQSLQDKVAILNISPYHSRAFNDYHMLAALPSCRASLEWAQGVLFPQAERGERTVVCLRSANYWGLGKEKRYGAGLFAPAVGMAGFMHADQGAGNPSRDYIIEAVKAALVKGPISN